MVNLLLNLCITKAFNKFYLNLHNLVTIIIICGKETPTRAGRVRFGVLLRVHVRFFRWWFNKVDVTPSCI